MTHTRRLGIALVLVSAVMWSTAGLFVRMAELDIWSIVGWRSLFTALVLYGWSVLRPKPAGERLEFGLPGVISTLNGAVAAAGYVIALSWTTVANVMTVYATLPFLAGLIGYVWLGERLSRPFLIAGLVAFAGVCVMVGAGFGPRDVMGVAVAMLMTACFAMQLVIARRYPRLDTTRMIVLAAVLCLLVALPNMPMTIPSAKSLLACALYGIISTGIGYILVLIGGRLIGPGEAAFLSLIDVVLGPVWVWLVFGETVSPTTFVGGGAVLLAVVWYLAVTERQNAALAKAQGNAP